MTQMKIMISACLIHSGITREERGENKMKRAFVLCGRLLLMVCMVVCFAHTAFAGSGNEAFRSVNHKGYNTMAPENTLPAFELSAEMLSD